MPILDLNITVRKSCDSYYYAQSAAKDPVVQIPCKIHFFSKDNSIILC